MGRAVFKNVSELSIWPWPWKPSPGRSQIQVYNGTVGSFAPPLDLLSKHWAGDTGGNGWVLAVRTAVSREAFPVVHECLGAAIETTDS